MTAIQIECLDLFNERRSLLKDKEDLIAANKLLQEKLKSEKKKESLND